MKEFKDKVVIVTGGARGIGRACCEVFADLGADIVFTYNHSEKEAAGLKKELEGRKAAVLALKADVRDYAQCKNVISETVNKFKKIDILVNNAGIIRDKALVMMEPADWQDVIDTNLNGTFNMTRSAIYTLLKQKAGCIINISSVSGMTGLARQTNYSASKAGIIGFTKALAKEVAAYNIRVNVVCPGFIETDMLSALKDEIKAEIVKGIPLKRMGSPEDIAYACAFLASDKAGYITGEAMKIDGGMAI